MIDPDTRPARSRHKVERSRHKVEITLDETFPPDEAVPTITRARDAILGKTQDERR